MELVMIASVININGKLSLDGCECLSVIYFAERRTVVP